MRGRAGHLTAALAEQRPGECQGQAAIAALLALTGNPLVPLSRAVAVGEVDGSLAGLRALDGLDVALGEHHRLDAVRAHLQERAGRGWRRTRRTCGRRAVRPAPRSGTT